MPAFGHRARGTYTRSVLCRKPHPLLRSRHCVEQNLKAATYRKVGSRRLRISLHLFGVNGQKSYESMSALGRKRTLLGEVQTVLEHEAVDHDRRPLRELERRQLRGAERLHRRAERFHEVEREHDLAVARA